MRQALLLAYYFPPIATSGSHRPLGFAQHFEAEGIRGRVISAQPESVHPPLTVDPQLASEVPADLEVYRLGHSNPLQRLLAIRQALRQLRGKAPRSEPNPADLTVASEEKALRGLHLLKERLLQRAFLFPDAQRSWLRPVLACARKLVAAERPDVIFATGKPWTSLVAGARLARKYRLPLVADFRDPWTQNPYRLAAAASVERLAERAEREVIARSTRVIANTPQLLDDFQARYPEFAERFVCLPNGFRKLLRLDDDAEAAGPFEMCHYGTLYQLRNPRALLEATSALAEQGRLSEGQLRLRFVGPWQVEDPEAERLARLLESRGLLVREGPVAHEECLRRMQRSSALLILQPASPLQIPAKIYEYVSTGRPLVIIGGEGATEELVRTHSLGETCPNEARALEKLLGEIAEQPGRLSAPSLESVSRFDYRNLTHELATIFEAAIQEHSARS